MISAKGLGRCHRPSPSKHYRKLTSQERLIVSVAAVGASCETDALIKIIERLTGEHVTPADEK